MAAKQSSPTYFAPSATGKLLEYQKQLEAQSTSNNKTYQQANNAYLEHLTSDGSRHPIASIIDASRPVRNITAEERQRQTAKWAAINDGIMAIGKSIANFNGVRTAPLQPNRALFNSLNELRRLDDVYKAEGYRYQASQLSEALRKSQRDDAAQATRLGEAKAERDYLRGRADSAKDATLQQEVNDIQYEKQRKNDLEDYEKQRKDSKEDFLFKLRNTPRQGSSGDDKAYMKIQHKGNVVPLHEYEVADLLNWGAKNGKVRTWKDASGNDHSELDGMSKMEQTMIATRLYNERESARNPKPTLNTEDIKSLITPDNVPDPDDRAQFMELARVYEPRVSKMRPNGEMNRLNVTGVGRTLDQMRAMYVDRLINEAKSSRDHTIKSADAVAYMGDLFASEPELIGYLKNYGIETVQ